MLKDTMELTSLKCPNAKKEMCKKVAKQVRRAVCSDGFDFVEDIITYEECIQGIENICEDSIRTLDERQVHSESEVFDHSSRIIGHEEEAQYGFNFEKRPVIDSDKALQV